MDRKWWTLIAVCVATFMLLLDVTIVNVALPSIQTSLKASFSDLQWVVDAYSLTLAALLLTTGSLADLWGRRLIFVAGLVVFSASSLASGLAQSPLWLNLARGAQGVGAAAMFATSLALLGSSFRGRERGVAFGVWGAITGLAVAIGPVIGGGLTSGLSWRWIFLVNVPIGVVAVGITLLRVEESRMPHARRPDLIGVVTFSGALGALVYALIKGNNKGWSSGVILGCLIGAGVLLVLFVIAELVQRDRAMFDLNLFRKPTFSGGLIAAFALSGSLFALMLYLTLYLQDILGFSAMQTGLRFLTLSGGILLTSALAGRLTSVVPIRFLIAPGLALVGVGLLLMRGVSVSTGWTHLIPGFLIAGAGTGLINPPLASTAIGVVRPERAGMASGINSTFRQVGIATGIAGLGAIFSHEVRTRTVSLLNASHQVSSSQAHQLAGSVANGTGARQGLHALPAQIRGPAAHALRAGFASGLNKIFLVGAIMSLVAALLTLILIRSKDFELGAARTTSQPGDGAAAEATSPDGSVNGRTQEPAPVAGATGNGHLPVQGETPSGQAIPFEQAAPAETGAIEKPMDGDGSIAEERLAYAAVQAGAGAAGEDARAAAGRTDAAAHGTAAEPSDQPPAQAATAAGPSDQPPAQAATAAGPSDQPPAQAAAPGHVQSLAPPPPPVPPGLGAPRHPPAAPPAQPTAASHREAYASAAGPPPPDTGSQPGAASQLAPPSGAGPQPAPPPLGGADQPSPPPAGADQPAPDRPAGHDTSMSSGGSPSTQDVRLVAAAVHSAEEAALTYAREIGEARKHLTAAIEHLDRAERARTMLNRHAGGLMGAESAPPPRRDTPVSTPSPGIAVAGETGPAVPAPPPRRPSGWGPEPTGNS